MVTENIVPGYSIWKESKNNKLMLSHYYLQNNKFQRLEALCPYKTNFSDQDIFSLKVDLAIEWLKTIAFPNLSKNSEGSYSYFSEEEGGYVSNYPGHKTVAAWPDTEQKLLTIYIENVTFNNICTGSLRVPPFLEKFYPQILQASNKFLASEEVHIYLCKKAEEMADFWASQIGLLGTNGCTESDLLHTIANSFTDNNVTQKDIQVFKKSMMDYTMEQFYNKQIPYYETDYSVGYDLQKVLEKGNLQHKCSKSFPWKTWKHFDFTDAPIFRLQPVN